MKKKMYPFLYSMPLVLTVYIPILLLLFEYHGVSLVDLSKLKYLLGVVLMIAGASLAFWAYKVLLIDGSAKNNFKIETQTLVKSGPYQYIRNPMDMGIVLMLLGEGFYFSSSVLIFFAVVMWGVMAYYVQKVEEFALANKYGQEYIEYKMDVNPWFPKMSVLKKLKAE